MHSANYKVWWRRNNWLFFIVWTGPFIFHWQFGKYIFLFSKAPFVPTEVTVKDFLSLLAELNWYVSRPEIESLMPDPTIREGG